MNTLVGSTTFRAIDIIRKKRDGRELSVGEIQFLVRGYTCDEIPDYQISAWLMASVLSGLSRAETASLTDAMLHSGEVLDLSDFPARKVDKHSTGGVGDKTSLILAPVAAVGGLTVPMISGRGLGHTGGTLDKLESIPGFNVNLSLTRFRQVLESLRLFHDWTDRGNRACGSKALCPARRHGNGGKSRADLCLHHEQEAGRRELMRSCST